MNCVEGKLPCASVATLFETEASEGAHLVLRGGLEANVHAAAAKALARRGLDTGIVLDCSNATSGKGPKCQLDCVESGLMQRRDGQERLIGPVLESHLVAGRQDEAITYEQSVTAACLDWDETEQLIERIADG